MAKTMAEVLAEHQKKTGVRDMKTHCVCGWVGHCLDDSLVDHVAAALSAAGYGLVADAKRGALEEAADMVDEGIGAHGQEEYVDWLRARAAEMRQG